MVQEDMLHTFKSSILILIVLFLKRRPYLTFVLFILFDEVISGVWTTAHMK